MTSDSLARILAYSNSRPPNRTVVGGFTAAWWHRSTPSQQAASSSSFHTVSGSGRSPTARGNNFLLFASFTAAVPQLHESRAPRDLRSNFSAWLWAGMVA